MKVIDLLNKIANGEEVPKKIKFDNRFYLFNKVKDNYYENENCSINWDYVSLHCLNEEVEILDDEEDKDIPLIPDDELWNIEHINLCGVDRNNAIDYNFKVLKEKINQVVKEFNEYRRENEKENSNDKE